MQDTGYMIQDNFGIIEEANGRKNCVAIFATLTLEKNQRPNFASLRLCVKTKKHKIQLYFVPI